MEKYSIAGYCRISVDEELDKDNTSIENQKAIIEEYVRARFPESELTFYADRDRSGYTFDQREFYQIMRRKLIRGEHQILVVKDFSRFSRRNSKGLVELEDLRDSGVRIIAIADNIDYPTCDEWMQIQFRFLINEMPVTDASKKVKSVIKNRQKEGKWLCAVPYGYRLTGGKNPAIVVEEECAEVVRKIFQMYADGYGYRKIANFLTDCNIPTPRMYDEQRHIAEGGEVKSRAKAQWSIVSVSEILRNDFYIGTFRQAKYRRNKINGADVKTDESEHIVFENHHEPIVDYRLFSTVRKELESRSKSHYRGIKKYENVYSGIIFCGDCGSPMFSISNPNRAPAYTCGSYHKRGLKGCTSHHTRCDVLDEALKSYIKMVRDNSREMIAKLDESLKEEKVETAQTKSTVEILRGRIEDAKNEMKLLVRQKVKEIARSPENESLYEETYGEMLDELAKRVDLLESQIQLIAEKQSATVRLNRTAKTAIDIFDDVIEKDKLSRSDLEMIVEKILVFEDRIEISLKPNIDALLRLDPQKGLTENFNCGTVNISKTFTKKSPCKKDKVIRVNVISEGDPLEIYTSPEGEVIFKKYSPVGEISSTASQYADVLSKVGGCPAVICDRDHVIAVSGMSKKEIIERRVSGSLEDLIEQRKSYVLGKSDDKRLNPIEGVDRYALVCSPILASGDVNGAVIMLSGDNEKDAATAEQSALVQAAAMYFGKQMEE